MFTVFTLQREPFGSLAGAACYGQPLQGSRKAGVPGKPCTATTTETYINHY